MSNPAGSPEMKNTFLEPERRGGGDGSHLPHGLIALAMLAALVISVLIAGHSVGRGIGGVTAWLAS